MKIKWIIFILLCLFFSGLVNVNAESPEEILFKSDIVRSPQYDYSVKTRIINKKPGKEDKIALYEVLLKGRDNTIIKTLAPEVDRGTNLLMLKYDLWVFMKTISKPLRISLQQRLFGEAANGDIARANFSGDYTPKLMGVEDLNGHLCHVLELFAKDERVTYHKVTLWVKKENYHPIKAEFFAFSGKLLKVCFYTEFKDMLGVVRPTRMILIDPLVKGKQTIIDYTNMREENFPDKIFTKHYLKKLKY
ncbi:outer membrane lipoprotein-sorting protein [Desulfobacter postgatei]|uniref:outer membrane lipoprotein-sorting protein n=1 Tax=Desulfobacter postgatei TaxID=2293 RepID=UPI002A35CA54|nr:outer membrane lipoprotein-sorting protein [Desulfobacter postgatei]MDX9962629.1 outer membrane lipoprotein-sorting protein [Desulfobacter postgatei]